MKKKIITITAMALANAFATSPQVQNASKVYDILGRTYDKVTAQRVIKNSPTVQAQITEDNFQYSSLPTSKSPLLKVREPDENTLAVGQDINFPYQIMVGPYATPKAARKDTKLLFLGWGKHIEERGWDKTHVNNSHWDDEEAYRCWIVAAQEMNHAYMKKLGKSMAEQSPNRMLMTQDEIKFHVFHNKMDEADYTPVNDFPLGGRGAASNEYITEALNFALGTNDTKFYGDFGASTDFTEWKSKNNVMSNITRSLAVSKVPVVIGENEHIMVVDAYAFSTSGVLWIRLLNPNNDGSFQWRTFKSVNICGIAVVPQNQVNPSYSDPLIHKDSDNDGIMDFDEKYRFHTKYTNKNVDWDSDGDHISDKEEIRAYTLRALPDYIVPSEGMSSDPSERPLNTWNNVFIANAGKNYWADANKNGKNAELDPLEQGNNNFNPRPVYATDDVPTGIDIYALETINVGSNVDLNTVDMAAEKASSGTTITVSANSRSNVTLYTQGSVVFNGGAKIHTLEKFSDNNSINVNLSNGSKIEWFQDNNPQKNWPWQVKTDLPSISCGTKETLVKSGVTFTLKNGAKYSSLRIMGGATLVLEPGEVYIKSLTLYEGAKVKYSNSLTTIHINGNVIWNAQNSSAYVESRKSYVNKLKLIHHGTATLNITSGWYGKIYAPNANVNLGSNGGDIYGRFVGKNINIAPGTRYNRAVYH